VVIPRTWEVVARIVEPVTVPDGLRAIADHLYQHAVLKQALKKPGLFQARIDPLVLSVRRGEKDSSTLRVTVRPVDPPLEEPAPTPAPTP
jgi:hypothetical protein